MKQLAAAMSLFLLVIGTGCGPAAEECPANEDRVCDDGGDCECGAPCTASSECGESEICIEYEYAEGEGVCVSEQWANEHGASPIEETDDGDTGGSYCPDGCPSGHTCIDGEGCLEDCTQDSQCTSGCCAPTDSGGGVCADPTYCDGSGDGGSNDDGSGESCTDYSNCLELVEIREDSCGGDGRAVEAQFRNNCSHPVETSICLSTTEEYADPACSGQWECWGGTMSAGETDVEAWSCDYTGQYRAAGTRTVQNGGDPIGCLQCGRVEETK